VITPPAERKSIHSHTKGTRLKDRHMTSTLRLYRLQDVQDNLVLLLPGGAIKANFIISSVKSTHQAVHLQ